MSLSRSAKPMKSPLSGHRRPIGNEESAGLLIREEIREIRLRVNAVNAEYRKLEPVCKYWSYYGIFHANCAIYYSPVYSPNKSWAGKGDVVPNRMALSPRSEHTRVFAEHAIGIFKDAVIVQRHQQHKTAPFIKEPEPCAHEASARVKQLDAYVMDMVHNHPDHAAMDAAWSAMRALCIEIGECAANDVFTRRFDNCLCRRKVHDTTECRRNHGCFTPRTHARPGPPPSLETVTAAAAEVFDVLPDTFRRLPALDDAPPAPAPLPAVDPAVAIRSLELCWDEEDA